MTFENEYARFWVDRGILFCVYNKQVDLELSSAKQIVADRLAFQREVIYPVLYDVNGVRSIDLNARRYLAVEGMLLVRAVALVCDTPLSQVFSRLYLTHSNTIVPSGMFSNKQSALRFLSHYTV